MRTATVGESRASAAALGEQRGVARLQGYRYGIVLLLLVVTYVIEVASPTSAWTRVVTVALQGLTLVVAMAASRMRRSTIRVTGVVVALCTVAAVAVLPAGDGEGVRGSFYLVSLAFVVVAPAVIVRGLAARPVIDVRTVLGALCVYVLAGMTFAFAYGAIGTFGAHAFFAQQRHATISDYLYFSFVTLTTVGYGDLTAAGGLGRAAAVLEALLGQIYLVTVVALLVGAMGRGPRGAPEVVDYDLPGRDGGDAT